MTSVLTIQAQIVNTNPDPNGEPWCAGGLPEITPPVIRELEIDVSLNNWGSNFNHAQHLASNVTVDYTYLPLWNLGDCSNESFDNASMMLASADSLVSTGEYVEAKDMYMQVVEDYPTTTSAATALKTLLSLEYNAGNDYEELQQYYLENDVIVNDTVLSSLASSLANKCNEELGNYTDAIAWYEEVITNPESSFNDSIFATIDLGNLYLNMADDRAKGIQGKLSQFVPESRKEYQEQTDYALSLLPKDKHTQNKSNIPNIVKDCA